VRAPLWPQPIQLHRFGPDFWTVAVAGNIDVFEPLGIVGVREIFAIMRTAAIFARKSAVRYQFGSENHVSHVEGLLPCQVESAILRDAGLAEAILQNGDLRESPFQLRAISHDAHFFPSDLAEFIAQNPRAFSLPAEKLSGG